MIQLVDDRSPWASRVQPCHVPHMTMAQMNNPFNRFGLLLSDRRVVIDRLQKEHLLASGSCSPKSPPCKKTVRRHLVKNRRCDESTATNVKTVAPLGG